MDDDQSRHIPIACRGADALPHTALRPFQGRLKHLPNAKYSKLKKEIMELGFSEPISVWVDPKGVNQILNGHQRLTTVTRMVDEEGFVCPPLPVNFIEARDAKEAKRKVLSLASQFGEVSQEGLAEFLSDNDISFNEFELSFELPGIDLDDLKNTLTDPFDDDAASPPAPRDPGVKNFNITYTVVFDELEQQQSWFELMRWLKTRYPEEATIGAKLHALSQDLRSKDP